MYKKAAIVGRPNVGKSTLFNRFAGRKKAIVHDIAGTTRDRNDYEIKWKDKHFIITDTAGWSSDDNEFSESMSEQLNNAIIQSDIIIFLVDGKFGILPFEPTIAKKLRRELKKRGARVYLTRKKDKQVGLYDRVDFAKEKNADILLSIHQNSLPDRKDIVNKYLIESLWLV